MPRDELHSSTSPLPLYMDTSSLICQVSGITSSFTILLQILVSQSTACSPAALIISAVTPEQLHLVLLLSSPLGLVLPVLPLLCWSRQLTAHHSTHSPHSVAFQNILSIYLKPALQTLGVLHYLLSNSWCLLYPFFLSFFFCLAILKMFCLPSLESNVSACFFITSACTLAIHLLASFLNALYSACFISFSHSSAFFHSFNFSFLVSTAFSTSSHHHQVSVYICLLLHQTATFLNVFLVSGFFSFRILILGCTLCNSWWFLLFPNL